MKSGRTALIAIMMLVLGAFSACSKSGSHGAEGELIDGDGVRDTDIVTDSTRYGEGNIPYAKEGGSAYPDIHFDFDSAVALPEDAENVRQNAKKLAADPSLYVELEGHCDKRGTAEYNMALGEERAKSIAALVVNYGVSSDRVTTISYGEEIPIDPSDNDSAYAKNRRVHFAVYRKTGSGGR